MKLVIIESPFAAATACGRWINRCYARRCLRDSCLRGEAPLASHLLYTQALDDGDPHERKIGIECGLSWGWHADATVVYGDLGSSRGMVLGVERAEIQNRVVEYRRLWPEPPSRRRTIFRLFLAWLFCR